MEIHHNIQHVKDFIEQQNRFKLEDIEPQFQNIMRRIKKFKGINIDTKLLEVGSGSGWFLVLCKKNGILCEGLEICPEFVEFAQEFGRRYGIELDIKLENIEVADIGKSKYDIILALSTFEHVEHWQMGMKKVFDALRPGGLLYFCSTNKFSLGSGEYRFPLYGWLPDKWRHYIRTFRRGKDIMKLGIDFNQFTYFRLREFFVDLGFSNVLDQFEIIDPCDLIRRSFWKRISLRMIKKFKLLKLFGLIFSPGTLFICIK
jgi:2-polyprenyl-3-methyl-5-hydroxy-6-metoxy-1,4-benzoquinol methylase